MLHTPTPFEHSSNPHLPDLTKHNAVLAKYVETTQHLARQHRVTLVDLFSDSTTQATSNGRHLIPEAQSILAKQIAHQLGVTTQAFDTFESLREAVIEKHRLWLNYWRPSNWKLLFGDDARRQFTKGPITLREEWQTLVPLIVKAEERIQSIALHQVDPGPKRPPKETLHGDPLADIEEELAAFTVPEGFKVNLFASENEGLTSPLNLRWDPSGRMYVTVTTTYPHVFPGGLPDDKIIALDDTNHDGLADRSTVFAEGLNIPTGIEWGNGGVYVGQNTEILFLKDTDGDGRADERQVLLSGFGDGDSHQTINSFVWSPDGQLYFGHGDGCESRVETPWGTSALFNAGYYKLRPNRLNLVPFLEAHMGPGNPWGIGFDPWGQSFGVDGAGGVSWLAPAQVSTTHRRRFPRIGNPGGYCGIGYLDGEHLPDPMRGSFVIGDYKANRISRFSLTDQDSGFELSWEEPLLKSSHRNFRPVDVKMGPDGAIYVVDWYNPITCHQDDAFRDPTRDKAHGRIWRVSVDHFKDHLKQPRPPNLLTAPISDVIKALSAPNTWTRYQAKRALTARPRKEIEAALDTWVDTLDPQNPNHTFQLHQALTAYATIETIRPALLTTLLESSDFRVRVAATKLIGRWQDRLDKPLELLSKRVHDTHDRVRLEAIVACSSIASARSMQIVSEVMNHPIDSWTDYALKQTIHRLHPHWLPAFKQGKTPFEKPDHLAFILNEIKDEEAIKVLKNLVDSDTLDNQASRNAIISILAHGDPSDLYAYGINPDRHTRNGHHDTVSHAAILEALAQILESRPTAMPLQHLRPLQVMALHKTKELQKHAIRLIGLTGYKEASATLITIAADESLNTDARTAALEAMGALNLPKHRDLLVRYATQAQDPLLRLAGIISLTQCDIGAAAEAAANYLTEGKMTESQASQVVTSLVRKVGGSQALAAALNGSTMNTSTHQQIQRILYTIGNPDPILLSALNQNNKAPTSEKSYSESLVHNLAIQAKQNGNARSGRTLYEQLACQACHQINGMGGLIGPDLTSIGTTLSSERIIEEIIWPGRQIKEGYTPIEVSTTDDRILIGYERTSFQRPDEIELILRDTVSTELIKIKKEDIQSTRQLGSMMPEGLTEALNEKELIDLIHYLIQLGKQ